MRDIIFRGNRVDNGEWVIGVYVPHWGTIETVATTGHDDSHIVRLDSVGQYTGLTDKNGKRIFEGDIVSVPMALNLGQKLEPMIGFIEWLNGAFSVTWKDADYGRHFAGYLEDIEVIGNIYDNQELLK